MRILLTRCGEERFRLGARHRRAALHACRPRALPFGQFRDRGAQLTELRVERRQRRGIGGRGRLELVGSTGMGTAARLLN